MYALLKRIRLVEWLMLAITAGCQLLWTWSNSSADPLYIASFICLGLAAVIIIRVPRKTDSWQTIALYVAQGALYAVAMSTGTFRLYGLIFLLLALKLALLSSTRATVILASSLFLSHASAHLISQHFYKTGMHAIVRDGPLFATINFVEAQIISATLYVAVILFARAAMAEQMSRRKANRLTKEVEAMAVAVERGRIVRDVHDGVGHSLTSLNIQLELTAKFLEDNQRKDEARQSLEISRKIAVSALADLRRAVQSIAQRIKEQGQISFDIDIDDASLSTAARHNLLLVVKECLTNIQKHSEASTVQIHLASQAGKAELVVTDNGHGFESADKADGLGIKGMHERIASLGGTFAIHSDPGKGTQVLISLPT